MRQAKRRHDRFKSSSRAFIFSGNETLACTVENMSPSGACLVLATDAKVLSPFSLFLRSDEPLVSCETVWRCGDRLGVRFP